MQAHAISPMEKKEKWIWIQSGTVKQVAYNDSTSLLISFLGPDKQRTICIHFE